MIAVNELIQDAYKALVLTGLGESTDGDMSTVGENELNRLISTLNSQGFLALAQKFHDLPSCNRVVFKKLQPGETAAPDTVDMEPPEKVEAVARKIGDRFAPLASCDLVQISARNRMSLSTSWNYSREFEQVQVDGQDIEREVGLVRFDGRNPYGVRVFFNSKLPRYTQYDNIYLSDLYNELLFTGLKYRLACFYELSDSKKADCESEFRAAKRLIKRNNVTQRMLQCGSVEGGYDDSFWNGMGGVGF